MDRARARDGCSDRKKIPPTTPAGGHNIGNLACENRTRFIDHVDEGGTATNMQHRPIIAAFIRSSGACAKYGVSCPHDKMSEMHKDVRGLE